MESDALLRRVEYTAIALCGTMTIAALWVAKGSPQPAMAVLGGGLLIGTSYWSIKRGMSNLLDAAVACRAGESHFNLRADTLYSVLWRTL